MTTDRTATSFSGNKSEGSTHSVAVHQLDIQGLRDVEFLWDEPLARHTTFRVGGPVRCLARPVTEEALLHLLSFVRDRALPHVILGGGSNVLAPDDPWDILVIQLTRCSSEITREPSDGDASVRVFAGAGVSNSRLLQYCARDGLSGLEFLAGIPGTLGGAAIMNAGTHEGCLSNVLEWLDVLNNQGERERVGIDELPAGYRNMGLPEDFLVLGAAVRLRHDESDAVRRKLRQIIKTRKQTQPAGRPSAGCIFKNPVGQSAGALIDKAGLKGCRVGDAQVSEKHANWIVNLGNARARDILRLIDHVERAVFKTFGVRLEREVRVLS